VVNLQPGIACLALALAAAVAPGTAGADRLARLGRRVPAVRSPRPPATAVAGVGLAAGLLALGPVGALAGGAAAIAWQRRRGRRQASDEATATAGELAEALGRITEELRAGAHPAAALAGTAADGPLARAVLAPAATAAALGEGIPTALTAAAARHPDVACDLRRVARTWALADRHGVPAAELLTGVLADIRWRVTYAGRVRAQLAGPRATAAVLTALPALGIALGELVDAGPLAVLRSGVLGQLLVVLGVGLVAAGTAWTERILRAAVPR
jgi:tight adherence protein B